MVLKTINLTAPEIAKWLAAIGAIASMVWLSFALIATLVWRSYGQEWIKEIGLVTREDVLRIEARQEAMAEKLATMAEQIVILSRPDDVVHYRDLPRPSQGYCKPGEVCPITIFAERDLRAVDCRVVPGITEMFIVIDNREYVANTAPNRPGTNLSASPRALEPRFILPLGLPAGQAVAMIRSHYIGCPWQDDEGDPPVIQDSPRFPLEIRP